MTIGGFDGVALWRSLEGSGMMVRALVKQSGKPAVAVWIGLQQPDELVFGVARSRDYEMEYLYIDLPALKQGDPVTLLDADDVPIPKEKYTVRETPYIANEPAKGNDGTYRRALLTRIAT